MGLSVESFFLSVERHDPAIVARYSYDPYGRTTLTQGTNLATFQYADYFTHQTSGLNLTKFREYDPNIGRWLSRDSLLNPEIAQGPNLYKYARNNPLIFRDSLGLACEAQEAAVARAQAAFSSSKAIEAAAYAKTVAMKRIIEKASIEGDSDISYESAVEQWEAAVTDYEKASVVTDVAQKNLQTAEIALGTCLEEDVTKKAARRAFFIRCIEAPFIVPLVIPKVILDSMIPSSDPIHNPPPEA